MENEFLSVKENGVFVHRKFGEFIKSLKGEFKRIYSGDNADIQFGIVKSQINYSLFHKEKIRIIVCKNQVYRHKERFPLCLFLYELIVDCVNITDGIDRINVYKKYNYNKEK